MARKRNYNRRVRKRGLIRGTIEEEIILGALTTEDMITQSGDNVVSESTLIMSIDTTWAYSDHTAGEGPLVFGVNHSDYSSAEVDAWFEATGSWNEADLVAKEVNSRLIRILGQFAGGLTEEVFNDGKSKRTKLNWRLSTGQTLDYWVRNRSGTTLTTGTVVKVNGIAWLRPL